MDFDIKNPPEEITMKVVLLISELGFIHVNNEPLNGYTQICEPVEVTFKIKQREKITGNLVDELKAKSQKIKAAAEVKCNQIADKINQLLALQQL